MTSLRVAFAGTPEFAVPVLAALSRSTHRLVGVFTQPDRPRGRGQRLTPSPVKLAVGGAAPLAQPERLRSPLDWAPLLAWRPDALVVVAYGLILPSAVLEIPRLGCINVHASLLPRWRGAAPVERALLAGDETTGITIMLMDAGLDTGPVLLQRLLHIDPRDTAGDLRARLAALAGPVLLEALDGLAAGTLRPRPQPTEGVTYARKLEKSEARIDWSHPAAQIERQVRALQPWPVAETVRIDPTLPAPDRLLVYAARLGPASSEESPGVILEANGHHESGYIRVQCGVGTLELLTLQRPGGPRLAASVFTRGPRRLERHMVLGGPA